MIPHIIDRTLAAAGIATLLLPTAAFVYMQPDRAILFGRVLAATAQGIAKSIVGI